VTSSVRGNTGIHIGHCQGAEGDLMLRPTLICAASAAALAGLWQPIEAQQDPAIDFSQVTRPVVLVTDSLTIDYLLFELFVEPLEQPTRLQLVDVTQNGFGPDDVMVVYPSVEVYLIPEIVPDSVQTIMSGWQPEAEYRMDSGNMSAEALASLIGSEPDSLKRAEGAILYDLVNAVERSYRDLPVALLFQRDSVGFTFQLWDYNRPSLRYTERADLVADSAATAVLDMLRDVGYVPGSNAGRTGLSLESLGYSVASVSRALQGMTQLPDEQMRILAAQTVLLGSFDFDRSGAIDRASEIDAPTCSVWSALNESFPDYLEQFGFSDGGEPYVGDVVFAIAENVRTPAYRRSYACSANEEPPTTNPTDVSDPTAQGDIPADVARFVRLEAAGEILQRAGRLGTESAEWSEEVRGILEYWFDRDASGQLDSASEIRSIPCDVWQSMAATHPDFSYGLGFLAGDVYSGDHLGVAPDQREEVLARASGCVDTSVRMGAGAEDDQRSSIAIPDGLRGVLDLLTAARIARTAAGMSPGSVRWASLIKSSLIEHYDLDGSGALDQTDEIVDVPCPVWATIEATYGAPLSELGLGTEVEYLADNLGIAIEQRLLAGARIERCRVAGTGN
jgi:hypothetical protein